MADALASAHRRGIFHGDVKPANILLTADDLALLADFDIAAVRGTDPHRSATLGSAAYLAPELIKGGVPSPSSDLYALGVVAYEALTGRLPFDGPTAAAVIAKAETGDHEVLDARRFGPFAVLVEQALAVNPRHRFDSAGALAQAWRDVRPASAGIAAIIATTIAPTTPPTPQTPSARTASSATTAGQTAGRTGGRGNAAVPDDELLGALRQVAARPEPAEQGTPGRPLDVSRPLSETAPGSAHQDLAIADDELRATTRFERPTRPKALSGAAPVVPRNRARHVRLVAAGITATAVLGVAGMVALRPATSRPLEGGVVAARVACDPATSRLCVDKVERTPDGIAITFDNDAEPTEFRVGAPTDALRVANWFCGSVETLAAYRPSTGVIYYFQSWPLPGQQVEVLADATGIVGATGLTVADSDGDRCADIGVERDGTRTWFLPVKQSERLQRVDMAISG